MTDMVRVDISNVAGWFYDGGGATLIWPDDYYNLVSPWAEAEYRYTSRFLISKYQDNTWFSTVLSNSKIDIQNVVNCNRWDFKDESWGVLSSIGFNEVEKLRAEKQKGWMQGVTTYARPLGFSKFEEFGRILQLINGDGGLIADRVTNGFSNWGIPEFDGYEISPFIYSLPIFFAISLMHCRNVEIRDRSVSRQQRRMAERTGQPVVIYKELVIDAFRQQVRYETERDGGNEIKRAIHICRGHFAHYTDDKPLFGKHTGTYWRPMHVRGSSASGQVHKTYKVEGPKQSPNT